MWCKLSAITDLPLCGMFSSNLLGTNLDIFLLDKLVTLRLISFGEEIKWYYVKKVKQEVELESASYIQPLAMLAERVIMCGF